MSETKKANSQAAWALISGGVNDARIKVHEIHQLVDKVLKLVEKSSQREHLYQVAGDIIVSLPQRVQEAEGKLDGLGYALSLMGKDHLRERLPAAQREVIENTIEGVSAFNSPMHRAQEEMAHRVAKRYLFRG